MNDDGVRHDTGNRKIESRYDVISIAFFYRRSILATNHATIASRVHRFFFPEVGSTIAHFELSTVPRWTVGSMSLHRCTTSKTVNVKRTLSVIVLQSRKSCRSYLSPKLFENKCCLTLCARLTVRAVSASVRAVSA